MSASTILLPFQPSTMSTAQLAAVSFLARYSGRTHDLYTSQLARWFAWCETQRAGPAGRDPARPRRAVHPPPGRGGADGLLGGDDDARRARVLPVRPHRRADHRRPGGLRPAAEGAARRVPHPRAGPVGADPVPAGRPDHHRPPRRAGVPARHQRAARVRGRGGADRGLRRHAARAPGAAPGRQGQQAGHHAGHRARCCGCWRPAAGSAPQGR